MAYKILYFDEVSNDIKEAKAWYSKQHPSLEKRFAASIKEVIFHLRQTPFVYAVRYKNTRKAHPVIFPYAIHFYIDDVAKTIAIIAIIHNSRRPGYHKHDYEKSLVLGTT